MGADQKSPVFRKRAYPFFHSGHISFRNRFYLVLYRVFLWQLYHFRVLGTNRDTIFYPNSSKTEILVYRIAAGMRGCFPAAVGPRPADGFGWDAHVADGCDFGCGSMTWPTP